MIGQLRSLVRHSTRCVLMGAFLAATNGCSFTVGHLVPNSQFAYPNSNIKSLGPVTSELKRGGWLFPPQFTIEDIKNCYNNALAKAAGANILINYKEGTTLTEFPLAIYELKYSLTGEAAQMTVGKQELK